MLRGAGKRTTPTHDREWIHVRLPASSQLGIRRHRHGNWIRLAVAAAVAGDGQGLLEHQRSVPQDRAGHGGIRWRMNDHAPSDGGAGDTLDRQGQARVAVGARSCRRGVFRLWQELPAALRLRPRPPEFVVASFPPTARRGERQRDERPRGRRRARASARRSWTPRSLSRPKRLIGRCGDGRLDRQNVSCVHDQPERRGRHLRLQ